MNWFQLFYLVIHNSMSLDSIIEEVFDLVWSRKFTYEELSEHIKRTYEISSDRIVDMILEWCEEKIKKFVDNYSLLVSK